MTIVEHLTGLMTEALKELDKIPTEEKSGELTHEQKQNLNAAYGLLVAASTVASKALDRRIRTVVEKSRRAAGDYLSGQIDAKALKAAIKVFRGAAPEIMKRLTAERTREEDLKEGSKTLLHPIMLSLPSSSIMKRSKLPVSIWHEFRVRIQNYLDGQPWGQEPTRGFDYLVIAKDLGIDEGYVSAILKRKGGGRYRITIPNPTL